jgi:hypothetical protein
MTPEFKRIRVGVRIDADASAPPSQEIVLFHGKWFSTLRPGAVEGDVLTCAEVVLRLQLGPGHNSRSGLPK